jgi:Trk K+ transport system NAD-binding subunit
MICTLILLGVIALSTLVLKLGVLKYEFSDALFRTVSIMATGGDMHEDDYQEAWMKVFVVGLRLSGAALTAAFTAIVVNYLLRARLGGALEMRRIPDGGHVVLCGLGHIGFCVIQELIALKEVVVAIELDASNRFIPTARRLGAPVIVGDATIREVLHQAHADTARAVIVATPFDLGNLETALLVRELNPNQRVVLLQSDPQLAQMLREGANIHLAVSVPALATPAFVAALFGDRVVSVILVGDRLLAVLDLVVQEQDAVLIGKTTRHVAADFRFLPAGVVTTKGEDRAVEEPLEAGDRVIAIVALADLERLLRRQAV